MKALLMASMLPLLAQACSRPAERTDIGSPQNKAVANPEPIEHAARRQLPAIDPRSTQAALDQVNAFVSLLNQGKFGEAYMLLGPGAQPRSDFDTRFTRFSDLRVSAGTAGDQEGAAGSIFLSVPLTVSGVVDGVRTSRSATAVLRRVNDVPGSTEAQRHWHIERLDWQKAP